MSAKSKKRLCKLENKLLKLEKLELEDVICSICQSILIEPVTLPCFHDFCQRCFDGSIQNNALCCPLCRLRIGSWLRTTTKQNNLVNAELWRFLQSKFSQEIDAKLRGDDVGVPEDIPIPRLSAPGEIRSEYEAELQRLKAERVQQEQKHIQETRLLIKKIQQEERDAQKEYLERLKQDELLAKQIQNQEVRPTTQKGRNRGCTLRYTTVRPKLKATKIDGYLTKIQAPVKKPIESPLLTDDNTSTDSSTPKSVNASSNESVEITVKLDTESTSSKSELTYCNSSTSKSTGISTNESSPRTNQIFKNEKANAKCISRLSPEVIPRNGKLIKNINGIKTKCELPFTFWNKENGDKVKDIKEMDDCAFETSNDMKEKKKAVIKSLLVSLPLPNSGVLQHKTSIAVKKTTDSDSVDSMRQELCFFKPIEKTSPTSLKSSRKLPIRVPISRVRVDPPPPPPSPLQAHEPTRTQYLDGLCKLRQLSLAKNLPSAFVIALNSLKAMKKSYTHNINTRQASKKNGTDDNLTLPIRKVAHNKKSSAPRAPNNSTASSKTTLRRTRSMGSMAKDENEKTPKKMRIEGRKAASDRKPHLRSDSKRLNATRIEEVESPLCDSKPTNDSKLNLAVKNLSSPLKNCDVKQILQEQLRIEQIIEQEKKDLEFARQMDAEWNGRRQLRRAPAKRQVDINYALRPSKKLKA